MLAASSSPSPDLSRASSPRWPYSVRSYNASHQSLQNRRSSQSIGAHLHSTATQTSASPSPRAWRLSPQLRRMVDASTQYSPQSPPPPSLQRSPRTSRPPVVAPTQHEPESASSSGLSSSDGSNSNGIRQESTSTTQDAPVTHPPSPNPRIDPVPQTQVAPTHVIQHRPQPSDDSQDAASKRARGDAETKLMPTKYENCDVKDLGRLISDMLMELVRINDGLPLRDGGLTRFHSRAPPTISVQDYLARLIIHATLSPPILLSMVYYIDRLCALYPAFNVSSLTIHRFLIAAATVGSKGLSDSFWTNATYARVGGVSLKELSILELEFLTRMDWRIVPDPEVLVDYYRNLVTRNPGYKLQPPQDQDQEMSEDAGVAAQQSAVSEHTFEQDPMDQDS